MARPSSKTNLSHGQASFVLERALAERKLSAGDVKRYLGEMHEEIAALEQRLARLKDTAVESIVLALAKVRGRRPGKTRGGDPPFPDKKPARGTGRKKTISAEVVASRQLQGKYISALRGIPKNKRPPFQAMAKEKGRAAAVSAILAWKATRR